MHSIFWTFAAEQQKYKQVQFFAPGGMTRALELSCCNYKAYQELLRLTHESSCFVVALTATPEKVRKHFNNVYDVPTEGKLMHYTERQRLCYSNLEHEISRFRVGEKYLIYITQITQIKRYLAVAESLGLRACGIWSTQAEKHPMDDRQLKVLEFILEEQRYPDNVDILFINRSCETCINIYTEVKAIFIHGASKDAIIQARGRIRCNIDALYLLAGEPTIFTIPERFLNTPLDVTAKRELSSLLGLKNEKGRVCGWTTVKKKLLAAGYPIVQVGSPRESKEMIMLPAEDVA